MENKISEDKMLKLIMKVNNALNSTNAKISEKINDLMEEISKLKEDVQNTRKAFEVKCKCEQELGKLRNSITAVENCYKGVEGKINHIRKQVNDKSAIKPMENRIGKMEKRLLDDASKPKDSLESSIQKIKDEQKTNSEEIKNIENKLLVLEQEQRDTKLNIEANERAIKEKHDELANSKEKTEFLSVTNENRFKCKLCDSLFDDKQNLNNHLRSQKHCLKTISCKLCEQKFEKISELEDHLHSLHNQQRNYFCETCDLGFILKWRMKKHLEGHNEKRPCYYFNNNLECPFSKIGCKFAHKKAANCKYAKQCTRAMCPFQHD